jgi:hypothetical protein
VCSHVDKNPIKPECFPRSVEYGIALICSTASWLQLKPQLLQ